MKLFFSCHLIGIVCPLADKNIYFAEIVFLCVCVCVKACPPNNLEVCALRSQVFIGLRSLSGFGRHVILLSTTDSDTPEEAERTRQRRGLYEDTHACTNSNTHCDG